IPRSSKMPTVKTYRPLMLAVAIAASCLVPLTASAYPGYTPFQLVNKSTGLCVTSYGGAGPNKDDALLFKMTTCSDTDINQKFYFLELDKESQIVPQDPGVPKTGRILMARKYDESGGPLWFNIYASSTYGSA